MAVMIAKMLSTFSAVQTVPGVALVFYTSILTLVSCIPASGDKLPWATEICP